MKTETTTGEYMLLFRGPHWDKGLSPEELQQVNEELEEKASLLAEQNQKVEQKNREVEATVRSSSVMATSHGVRFPMSVHPSARRSS